MRGLTLFEILIAIVVLIAIASLILPPIVRSLRQAQFQAAADQLVDQLRLARAHAQLNGTSVEVVYHRDLKVIEARVFEPDSVELVAVEVDTTYADRDEDPPPRLDAPDEDLETVQELMIAESWAVRRLDTGVLLRWTEPERSDDALLAAAPPEFEDVADPDFGEPPLSRVVVYLADGSALLGRPVWLTDNDGRVARFEINPWTGAVTLDDDPAPVVDESPDEDSQDMEDDIDEPDEGMLPDGLTDDLGDDEGALP